jgi:hypothetical protein
LLRLLAVLASKDLLRRAYDQDEKEDDDEYEDEDDDEYEDEDNDDDEDEDVSEDPYSSRDSMQKVCVISLYCDP